MQTHKKIPDCVIDRLIYDQKTGSFLWKYKNKAHPRLFGKKAGAIRDGYVVIKINGSAYKAHRLAWFIYYGTQPNVIDHINGVRNDNRIENLRSVSTKDNTRNHGRIINGSLLPCGVRKLPSGKYQARIRDGEKSITIGTFGSVDLAKSAYMNSRKLIFKEFHREGV